jgi:hypothetical protein
MSKQLDKALAYYAIRRLGEFSTSRLAQKLGVTRRCVGELAADLGRLGAVNFDNSEKVFRLQCDLGPQAPIRVGGAPVNPNAEGPILLSRQRLWACLRRNQGWQCLDELLTNSGVDSKASRRSDAGSRLAIALEKAGYLESQRAHPGAPKYVRLIRNTGPAAPVPAGGVRFFDPNNGKFYPEEKP